MGDWLKRLRGILGLGALGGAAGAIFGALWWLLGPILGVATVVMGDMWFNTLVWGFFGAFAGSGAAVFLSAVGRGRALEELSPWRVGVYGAIAGFLAPSAFLLLLTGHVWLPGTALIAGISSLVGATLGSGLVLVAQHAPPDELSAGASAILPRRDGDE